MKGAENFDFLHDSLGRSKYWIQSVLVTGYSAYGICNKGACFRGIGTAQVDNFI